MASELDRIRKYESLGNHHMQVADRALRQATLINSPKLKFFDAISLWHKAGKCFAIAGEWEDSAVAFGRAAEYMGNQDKPHEAAVYWFKSAEMYRRIDALGSIQRYDRAIAGYVEVGRFVTAANICLGVAELFEEERQWEQAIERYELASEYYVGENFNTQSCGCLTKVANLTALLERFEDASFAFERVAEAMIDDNLLRLNVPQVFLRAGLCQLANGGSIRGGLYSHKVLKYYMKVWSKMCWQFECSREKTFLDNLIVLISTVDMDGFADHVYSFDNVSTLEPWHIKLLNRVKEDIEEELELRAEEQAAVEAENQRLADERKAGFVSKYR